MISNGNSQTIIDGRGYPRARNTAGEPTVVIFGEVLFLASAPIELG
jgi:hypothetical protein